MDLHLRRDWTDRGARLRHAGGLQNSGPARPTPLGLGVDVSPQGHLGVPGRMRPASHLLHQQPPGAALCFPSIETPALGVVPGQSLRLQRRGTGFEPFWNAAAPPRRPPPSHEARRVSQNDSAGTEHELRKAPFLSSASQGILKHEVFSSPGVPATSFCDYACSSALDWSRLRVPGFLFLPSMGASTSSPR